MSNPEDLAENTTPLDFAEIAAAGRRFFESVSFDAPPARGWEARSAEEAEAEADEGDKDAGGVTGKAPGFLPLGHDQSLPPVPSLEEIITEAQVEAAVRAFDARVPAEFRGLLDAEVVE